MGALAVFPHEAEEFDRTGAGGSKPVRGTGVEFGCFPRVEQEIVLPEHKAERAVEDVGPIVPRMATKIGFGVVTPRWEHEFVGLDPSGSAS